MHVRPFIIVLLSLLALNNYALAAVAHGTDSRSVVNAHAHHMPAQTHGQHADADAMHDMNQMDCCDPDANKSQQDQPCGHHDDSCGCKMGTCQTQQLHEPAAVSNRFVSVAHLIAIPATTTPLPANTPQRLLRPPIL